MDRYPRKDKDARTGSSLRGPYVLTQRQAELSRVTKLHERLAKEQHRLTRDLFSKAEMRRAAEIGRQTNREFRQASIELDGDSVAVDLLKLAARKKLERMLARDLPQYRQWKKMHRAHMLEHQKLDLTTQAANHVANIDWGNLVEIQGTAQEFVPPFTSFDVQTIDSGDFVVSDDSFARPGIGHIVNDFAFDQSESTSIGRGVLGILPIENGGSLVSCGVAFTTPSAGRLKLYAELKNLYNRLTFSVTDKFGFSSAEVAISVDLFFVVVRGTDVEQVSQSVLTTGLVSHGSDLQYTVSDLDDTTPYTITAETATRLNANESVLVLAGSEVVIGTSLDDMRCKMDALLWWQLQKLVIDMAVDVIT